MTQVARVFVFLNLVLAAFFLAAAATFLGLQDAYTEKVATLETQLEDAEAAAAAERADFETRIEDLNRGNADLTNEKTQLETELRNRQGEVEQLQSQLAEKDNQIRGLSTTQKTQADTIEALRSDKNSLQAKVDEEEQKARDAVSEMRAAVQTKEEAEQLAKRLRDNINGLEVAVQQKNEKIADLENLVAYAQQFISLDEVMAMSPVTGQVLNYDPSLSLVQVNRGSEAGVERGYTLDITSNGRYLGRMRVDRVSPNICAGVMTVKNQRPGESFNVPVGAQATNRLN